MRDERPLSIQRGTRTGGASLMSVEKQQSPMPATLEVVCRNDECELDMFELHYTYDMPDDVGVGDFQCPYCGQTELLEAVEL